MKAIDMHCDTVAELYYTQKNEHPLELAKSPLEVDIEKLEAGDYLLQNFAIFIRMSRTPDPFDYCIRLAELFKKEIAKNPERISQVRSYADIIDTANAGKIAALLTLEEGEACEGDSEKLKAIYDLGVRMMTLTWNYENSLAWPNARPSDTTGGYEAFYNTENGLKPKGFEILEQAERLGIILDVSHLSDKGFYDVLENTKAPFVASHSNARAVCSHPRNLTDDMIKKLADRGGVTGINYFGPFLEDNNPGKISRVEAMVRHIKYLRNVGGIGCIGLGSDFDGISGELELKNCAAVPRLADALFAEGFTEHEVEAIFHKNVLRVYKEVLK